MTQPLPLLAVQNVSKSFGAFRALDDVSLSIAAGEVHGLLGANGAGKSTLIGVLSGAHAPDSGSVSVAGRAIKGGSLLAARKAGLAVVHQELMMFPDRSVEENIFASVLPAAPFAFVPWKDRRQRVEAVLDRLGAHIDVRRRVGDLPLSQQQIVEIARALCSGGRVLVLDEPTSSLSQPEAEGLFEAIRSIVAKDAAVIFVSHRLDEVFKLTDRITVLRDGRVEGRWATADTDIAAVTEAMVGQYAQHRVNANAAPVKAPVALTLRGSAPGVRDLDLSLRQGEVVGLAGLEGSGVSTVMEMLGGVVPVDGSVDLGGTALRLRHPIDAIRAGIVYMPPDRKKGGLWLDRSVSDNIATAAVGRMRPFSWLRKSTLDGIAEKRLVEVGVRTNALHERVGRLSGGNQQRVLLGRNLESRPRILLLSDFTRGVDVKAKAAIHQLVRTLANEGITVCLSSSDLEELLDVADRVVCFRAGRVVADGPSTGFNKLSLLGTVSGVAAA